jgi:hypothetical protein
MEMEADMSGRLRGIEGLLNDRKLNRRQAAKFRFRKSDNYWADLEINKQIESILNGDLRMEDWLVKHHKMERVLPTPQDKFSSLSKIKDRLSRASNVSVERGGLSGKGIVNREESLTKKAKSYLPQESDLKLRAEKLENQITFVTHLRGSELAGIGDYEGPDKYLKYQTKAEATYLEADKNATGGLNYASYATIGRKCEKDMEDHREFDRMYFFHTRFEHVLNQTRAAGPTLATSGIDYTLLDV